jgi:phosphoenolpyruvate carboxylase
VDTFVVEKLLSTYGEYFRREPLGGRIRLTPRVPNPRLERAAAKGLLEVLNSLPRHSDAARMFYGESRPPVYEVILPMTTSADELDRILDYYQRHVVGVETETIGTDGATYRDWFGAFEPGELSVIPLVEDLPYILAVDELVGAFLRGKPIARQRVFIARSDPALNYGVIPAILASLIAVDKLARLERSVGVEILPILGAGGAPFRGGLQPDRIERVLDLYPSVQTYTLQSAFKYDNPSDRVRRAIGALKGRPRGSPIPIADDARVMAILERVRARYRAELRAVIDLVGMVEPYVPKRRLRRLHVGLFGYGRGSDNLTLPRAITFCAGLTAIGLPPEFLGLAAVSDDDWSYLCERIPSFATELEAAVPWLDETAADGQPETVKESVHTACRRFDYAGLRSGEHLEIARATRGQLASGSRAGVADLVIRAGALRHYLG